jgi:nitrate reductase NapD
VTEELHISSLVVHSTPKRVMRVSDVIAAIEGAQVHAISPNGKLVVTLEASSADEMISKVARIQQTDGVLSAALVYECVDTLDAMNEVIPDVDDPKGVH